MGKPLEINLPLVQLIATTDGHNRVTLRRNLQLRSVTIKLEFVSVLVKVYGKPNSLFIRFPIKLDNVKS